MAMRGRGAGLFQGLKARDESRQKDEQLAIQRQNAATSEMQAASAGSGAFWAHQTASERNDLERQRLEMAQKTAIERNDIERKRLEIDQRKQDAADVRDEFMMRAQEIELENKTAEARKLAELNRQEVERMQNRRRMYETIESEAFFATATSGMFSDDGSIKTNTPAFDEELARRLGVKRASAYLDKNGFHIRYESSGGKIGTKDFDTDWCKSQSLYWSGDASMFGGGRLGKDGREQLGEEQRQAMEVATYGRKRAIDQENYERNKGEANLQSVLRSLSVEVGKGNMTQEEAEQAFAFYQSQAAKGAQGRGDTSPAPQKGGMDDAARQAELDALMKRKQELVAQRQGSQRNIPGMPKRQQEQPAPTPAQTQQQTQQPAPRNDEVVSKPTTAEERKAAIAKIAKEYNIDPGQAERALNIATGKYNQDQRKGGKRSYDSFVTEQITWMMNRGQRTRGRTYRR